MIINHVLSLIIRILLDNGYAFEFVVRAYSNTRIIRVMTHANILCMGFTLNECPELTYWKQYDATVKTINISDPNLEENILKILESELGEYARYPS